MNHSQLDLIASWQRYIALLTDTVETNPFLLPVIRRWASASALTNFDVLHAFQKIVAKILRLIVARQGNKRHNSTLFETQTSDILFLPGFARVNCLGTSQLVAQSLWKLNPNYNIGIIPPIEEGEANLPSLDERFIKYNFIEKKIPSPYFLRSIWSLFIRVREKINSDPILSGLWRKNWHLMLFDMACFYQNMQQAKELLLKTECRLVVCLNEQLWPGSALIPAAKELGIPTVQILHGTPTKLYWPFISDETWVWDKHTHAMFEAYGAPASRLYITGNIESAFWLEGDNLCEHSVSAGDSNKFKTCLFLSQWAGTRIWGIPGFDEPVNWLVESLLMQNKQWRVIVRLHPYDDLDAREGIQKKLGFLAERLIFSDSRTLLVDDIVNADVVCTGSSTALLVAIVLGKPGFLLWTPVMEYVHGKPYLPEEYVIHSSGELTNMMLSADKFLHRQRLKKGYKNAADVAANRILQLLGR